MNVILSELSAKKIDLISTFILSNWNESTNQLFLKDLKLAFRQIEKYPSSCPYHSRLTQIRKCIVSSHVSFFYKTIKTDILILTVIDNRQDPILIHKELIDHFK